MSDLCKSEVNTNIDHNGSSTQLSTSQPFRSKSSDNNRIQDDLNNSTTKHCENFSTTLQNTESEAENKVFTCDSPNKEVSDLTKQCKNINITGECSEMVQGDGATGMGKNARKKETRKQLKIFSGNDIAIPPPTPESPALLSGNNNSLHEFFLKQVSPMYAVSKSRYLENLCHHPQFQLTHRLIHPDPESEHPNNGQNQPTDNAMSSSSVPGQSKPTSPRFLENVLQHPLLSQTYHMRSDNFSLIPGNKILSKTDNFSQLPGTKILPKTDNFSQLPSTKILPKTDNFSQLPGTKILPKTDNFSQLSGNKILPKPLLTGNNVCINNTMKDVSDQNGSPRKKKIKNKDKECNDRRFDPYILFKEVEAGLKDNVFLEGVLRINPKQFQHSYVSSSDRSEQDILIDGMKNRNRALEGDIVVVKLLDSDSEDSGEENKQKKGKVVYIKEKIHNRTCIGKLKLMPDRNRQKALFIPRDHRIPRLNILATTWPDNFYHNSEAFKDTLFQAQIQEWSDTRFAIGKIISIIGQCGDMVSETKAILAQTDLDITPFGPEVRDLFPRLDYKIPDEEFEAREDCTKLCLFSIDPYNCRDIDDAVSVKVLDNGNYEIGVHIADVAHFLAEDTLLDQKVADKATTIYLVEKAYHMLPDELCLLCSLFPGVDKLAFSVFWEITKDAKVLSHRFSKTVINSCCQLAYEHAQSVLDSDSNIKLPEIYNGFSVEDVSNAINVIGSLAAIMRKTRFEGGALRIDQPKVVFRLNPQSGMPDTFNIHESKASHQMIEEFMLLANMTVAKRINDDHPKLAFLRCHPPPSGYMLNQLAKSLKPMGINLDINSAGDIHRCLEAQVSSSSTDSAKGMVLNMLCAKPMTRAKYFCADGTDDDEFAHYALNVPLYTHFTSPIRRYADIMVHRLLSASLNYSEMPKWEVDKVRLVAANCNKQKYNAKKAGELSTELYTLKYIEMNSPVETDAAVVEVRERYIDVIVIAMGLNRRIFANNEFPGQFRCIKHDGGSRLSKMELTWKSVNGLPEQKQIIEVFSILRIELVKGDDLVKVETKIVRPSLSASSS